MLQWAATPTQRQVPSLGDSSILAAFREMNVKVQERCPLETGPNRAINIVEMTVCIRGFAALRLRYEFKGQPYDA